MGLVAKVVQRHRLQAAGFRVAEDAEAAPSASMLAKSKQLVAELRSMLNKREKDLKGDLQGYQALEHMDRALKRYNPHMSKTVGFEREVQFLLVLIQRELDALVIDTDEVADLSKRFERLITT